MKKKRSAGKPYTVGKGKPPVESQFQPGVSGNPNGRPKGAKSARTLAKEELRRKLSVTVKGRKTKRTVAQISTRRIGDASMTGDIKSYDYLLTTAGEKAMPEVATSDYLINAELDEAILASYFARRRQTK